MLLRGGEFDGGKMSLVELLSFELTNNSIRTTNRFRSSQKRIFEALRSVRGRVADVGGEIGTENQHTCV